MVDNCIECLNIESRCPLLADDITTERFHNSTACFVCTIDVVAKHRIVQVLPSPIA